MIYIVHEPHDNNCDINREIYYRCKFYKDKRSLINDDRVFSNKNTLNSLF